jgi:MoaA/NifB/PqqE/SkfB family radical SAM enzyme
MERSLDIEITRRCNLRCDYCFVGWSRDWHTDLPLEVAEEVVREGAGRFDLLHITGGEPFARRDVWSLIELGLALGYPSVLVNTNGTMLSDEQVARLGTYRGRVRLSVSLDGPPALHDAVRGDGRFAQADRTIAALLAAAVPTTVMTVVTPAVLAVLPEFLRERMAAHPGLDGVTLFPVGVGPSGSQRPGAALASLDAEQLRLLAVHTALAFHAGVPVTVGAFPMINPLLKMLAYPASRMYQCTAGRGRVCVHADQGVSSCHPVKDPIYGRWSSGLFDRLGLAAAHAALRDRDFDGCRSCDHQEGCGHCRAFVTANGAPLLGNDRVCLDVVPGRRDAVMEESARGVVAVIAPSSLVRRRAERSVDLVRRLIGVLASGRLEELASIVTEDCDDRNPLPLQGPGRDGVCLKMALWRAMRPDAQTRLLEVLPTDEGATARWETEVAPGERAGMYVGRFDVRGGRIRAFEVTHVG